MGAKEDGCERGFTLLLDDFEDLDADGDDEDDEEGDDAQVKEAAELLVAGFIRSRDKIFLNEEREQDKGADEGDRTRHGRGGDSGNRGGGNS
jgi:hypothetical protein